MTKYKIRYLPVADLDLVEIDEGLSNFRVKASKFFATLEKQTAQLAKMPLMYPVYDDVPLYRKMIVLDYLVFYTVNEEKKRVDIHRIINGRMDVKRHLTN
jgi:plasmid stabilization system protein ParE